MKSDTILEQLILLIFLNFFFDYFIDLFANLSWVPRNPILAWYMSSCVVIVSLNDDSDVSWGDHWWKCWICHYSSSKEFELFSRSSYIWNYDVNFSWSVDEIHTPVCKLYWAKLKSFNDVSHTLDVTRIKNFINFCLYFLNSFLIKITNERQLKNHCWKFIF